MPFAYEEDFVPSTFVLVDEGWYRANIFQAEKKDKENSSGKQRWYEVTCRIQGGDFDGEDVKDTYVGLQGKSLFKIYNILSAIGTLATYYNSEQKRWFALPTPDEIEGRPVFIKVENEPFQSVKDGQPQWNADGTPLMLDSMKITEYRAAEGELPEFKPSRKRSTPTAPQGAPAGYGQPQAQQGYVAPQQQAGANSDLPW